MEISDNGQGLTRATAATFRPKASGCATPAPACNSFTTTTIA